VKTAAAEYEKQKSDAKPKIDKIDGELKALAAAVEPAMLEKYKQIRKQKSGTADIVIPLSGNRCGGCHFELPLSLIHTISAKGYITCEECGKIIYKVG
jgi:predicted  nucleic acid-binding Zn-ribbon protein